MPAFPPDVERWRPLVEKYFPRELVQKALYVIQYESGGRPDAIGDNGVAIGLFQIQDGTRFPGRPDKAHLSDAENNIRYAAQQLGAASGNFGAWGEGTTYNGKPFGALGNHPYPGGSSSMGSTAMLPTGDGSGQTMFADPQYQGILAAQRKAFQAWQAAGYPVDDSSKEYQAYLETTSLREDYESNAAGASKDSRNSAAQIGFENQIALGDQDLQRGQLAFDRYQTKVGQALKSADMDMGFADKQNAAEADLQAAREKSKAPTLMPPGRGGRYYAPSSPEKAIQFWMDKYGAGAEPPLEIPGSAGAGGAGNGLVGATDPSGFQYWQGQNVIPRPSRRRLGPVSGIGDVLNSTQTGGEAAPTFQGQAAPPAFNSQDTSVYASLDDPAKKRLRAALAMRQKFGLKARPYARGTPPGGHPGGPAMLAEAGPEHLTVPGMGTMMVNDPTVLNLPKGAVVTPQAEMQQQQAIQQMATSGESPETSPEAIQARRNDPNLQEKVRQSLLRALSNNYAAKPPMTPTLDPGSPDLWAPWRALSGVPAYPMPDQRVPGRAMPQPVKGR